MKPRSSWATKYGFYFAAVGSAFGLGNLWRFPYIVGSSGGGAFVILYLFVMLFVGVPLLIAELMLGKTTRLTAVAALQKISEKDSPLSEQKSQSRVLPYFGHLALGLSILLMSYYAVVSGWVLHFLMQYIFSFIMQKPPQYAAVFQFLMSNGWLQIALASVHLIFCGLVVSKGVQQGIERWIGFIMPVFGILLLFVMTRSLSLSGAEEALRFLFYPDFSAITTETLVRAVGHSFYTLSIGFGCLIVFGSYLREDTDIPSTGIKVAAFNTVISLLVGLVIFPIVFTGKLRVDSGPTLLFETVPVLLSKIGMGEFFGFAFFMCMYLAAFGASLGLLEASVADAQDRKKISRKLATWRQLVIVFVLAILPALSSNALEGVTLSGMSVLQTLDNLIIHWLLPVSAIGISIVVGHRLKLKIKRQEFVFDNKPTTFRIFTNWVFALRWVVPVIVGAALLIELLGLIF